MIDRVLNIDAHIDDGNVAATGRPDFGGEFDGRFATIRLYDELIGAATGDSRFKRRSMGLSGISASPGSWQDNDQGKRVGGPTELRLANQEL